MSMKPCREAVGWLKQFPRLADAWECCDRPDWMIWFLHKSERTSLRHFEIFARCCREGATDADCREVCEILAYKVHNYLDLTRCGQYALETSFLVIDYAAREGREGVERIRQCEFIRENFANPFN